MQQEFKPPQFYLRPAGKIRGSMIWVLYVSVREDVIRMLTSMRPWLFQKAEKADMVAARLAQAIVERDELLTTALALKAAGATWFEISRTLHISRVALRNYASTVKNIDLSRPPGFNNDGEWKKDRIKRGLCAQCGEKRTEFGTKWMCRKCADIFNAAQQERRQIFGRASLTNQQKVERLETKITQLKTVGS